MLIISVFPLSKPKKLACPRGGGDWISEDTLCVNFLKYTKLSWKGGGHGSFNKCTRKTLSKQEKVVIGKHKES